MKNKQAITSHGAEVDFAPPFGKEGKTEEELKQKLKKEAHKKKALRMGLKEIHKGIEPLEKLRSLQGEAGCG